MNIYRAKTIAVKPQWIQGYPVKKSTGVYLVNHEGVNIAVKEETLSCICPKRLNGHVLFDGDVLDYTQHSNYLLPSCKMQVKFDTDKAAWGVKFNNDGDLRFKAFAEIDEVEDDIFAHCHRIGNIFDTPRYLIEML